MNRYSILLWITLGACTPKNSSLTFNDLAAQKANPVFDSNYEVSIPIGGRTYVESTLRQIFKINPEDADYAVVMNTIFFRADFGDSCDYYEGSESPNPVTISNVVTYPKEFPRLACSNGINPTLPPLINPMRFAWTTRVCEALIKNQDGIRLTQLMQPLYPGWTVATANQGLFAPTPETVTKAYRKFYRLDDPAPEVLQGLLELGVPQNKANLDRWKFIWTTICISPEWQMIL